MATTWLKPLHIGAGRDVSAAISDIIDYVDNPQKTDHGRLISGYECDTRIADAEFLLSKRQYAAITGRVRGADDVIAYHTRQSFMPGEITPEDANRIGHELAMRLTKGKHAFIVCTHIDKHHVHNHVIINSTAIDCTRKFRNFLGSAWSLRRINDRLCLEHGLSIVEDPQPSKKRTYAEWLGEGNAPSFSERIRWAIDDALVKKPASFDDFLRLVEAEGIEATRRGEILRFKAPGQKSVTRCDTLKGDYTEQAIRERIEGTRVVQPRPRPSVSRQPTSKVGMLIDIQAAIQAGKGPGYERWAKVFNIKQLSRAVNYLKERGDMSFLTLEEKISAATARFNELSTEVKTLEDHLNANAALQKNIVNYSKTRKVYVEYRQAGYSKKFRAEHEADILIHQTAKKAFDELGYGACKRIPTIATLRAEYAEVLSEKKKAYAASKQAQADLRELYNVRANVEYLLDIPAHRQAQRGNDTPRA